MPSIADWVQDKKNMPIVLAATGIVFVAAILLVLKMNGFIGAPKQEAMPQAVTPMPGEPQPGMPGGEMQPGVPPGGQPGMPGGEMQPGVAPGAAPAQPVQSVQQAKLAPMLPYRKDPFMPLTGAPKKTDVIAALLPSLRRPRLAPASVFADQQIASAEEVLPPQPFRRMSGVLYNGKVSGILETNGQTDVVRPGMELTRGNSRVRVESITRDSIILKTLDTKTPFTIKVNMAGSVMTVPGDLGPQSVMGSGAAISPGE